MTSRERQWNRIKSNQATRLQQRPGITILSRSAVSTHPISVIESGFRFSHVWYFKAAVLDPSLAKKRSDEDEDEDDFSPPDKKSPDVSQNDGPARRSDRERAAPQRFPGMVSNVVGLEEEASETGSTEIVSLMFEKGICSRMHHRWYFRYHTP